MSFDARAEFAHRLVSMILARGHAAPRGGAGGVNVAMLSAAAKNVKGKGVTREMARRYATGAALPEADRMRSIAAWLKVRVGWLRDGEGEPDIIAQSETRVSEPIASSYGTAEEEIAEISRALASLPAARRNCYRQMIFFEAGALKLMPWLSLEPPRSQRYEEFEQRIREDFQRFAQQLGRGP